MMKFNSVHVVGKNIDDTWFQLLRELYQHGRRYRIDAGSFAGSERLEFDFVSGTILEPVQYTGGVRLPLAVTVPDGVPAPTTDADIEEYFVNYLMDSTLVDNEHYRYSTFVCGGNYNIPVLDTGNEIYFNKIIRVPNQLQWCIDHFKKAGFSNNHCCVAVAYPESNYAYTLEYKNETERGTSPCLRLIDFKIINDEGINYLCMNVYFRSWALVSGWPTNMGGLALLQEYVAMELGVQIGTLSYTSKGLHAYSFEIDMLKSRIGA